MKTLHMPDDDFRQALALVRLHALGPDGLDTWGALLDALEAADVTPIQSRRAELDNPLLEAGVLLRFNEKARP